MIARTLKLAGILLLALVPARGSAAPDIRLHGLLDLVESNRGVALESNWFNYGDSNFDAYRLRLFGDAAVTDRLEVYTQLLFTDAAPARALGAYVSYAPAPDRDLHLWAGKIPWIVGTFASRAYSNKNPLISVPLLYQYHTTLRADQIVPSVTELLARTGRGQYGVTYVPGQPPMRGMSVVYDLCWDMGIAALGSARPFELAVGMSNGTPGRMNAAQDENAGKSILGRLGFQPWPLLRLGVSGSTGAYMAQKLNPALPTGKVAEDYRQRLVMADAEIMQGPVELRGEAYRNFWDTPTVGVLEVDGWYVEGKWKLPWSTYVAGRWERMEFGDVATSTGERTPWDVPRTRLEAGLGFRLSHDVLLKTVYQRFAYAPGEVDDDYPYHLVAAQLGVGF